MKQHTDREIRIGTSGYSYKDWEGVLYPQKTPAADYLSLYAQVFDTVELNYTYYRMPDAALSQKMVQSTNNRFIFAVKVHKSITHEGSTATVTQTTAQFMRGIEPIVAAGKLGVVLLQFPFSFHYTASARTYVAAVCEQFTSVPIAIEFRNIHWQRQSVYDELYRRNCTLVNVDEPHLPGLPRVTSLVTSDIGYVRFHGRNRDNWWKGDNVTRYDYCYSEEELQEWVPRIQTMALQAAVVLVVFNNHSKGQAVQNARKLRELIQSD